MSLKTIFTDYYRADVNSDGSLTFFNKNDGTIILENSPHAYFNSEKISNGNNAAPQITTSSDVTTVTVINNDNPMVSLTYLYRLDNHKPYIDFSVTWRCKKECSTSEERFDFIVPSQDAEILTRDLHLTSFNPANTYWSDLYTPKVVKFTNGLHFLGSDTMESMKIQASAGKILVSFYSDFSENHPHSHYVKNGGGSSISTNQTLKMVNDTSSASIQFAVTTGETLPYLIKSRQPYGYDAVLLFTSHPDSWTIESAKATAYGSANEKDASFGRKGIVGRGLGWTHGTFKNGQWYSLEYSGKAVKEFMDKLFQDGVEIVPHSITPETDNRTVVEQGLETFKQYNCRNWIDHGASAGTGNFEDLASQGALKNNENYILDILAKFNYQYAWSYIDLATENYEINLLKPGETSAKRPVFFHNNQVDDNTGDKKKIFLWSTMNTIKKADLFYTPPHVDALINEKGVHIGHEYFGYPTCENHVFYKNNGTIEICPTFDAQLEYIAQKRTAGLIWSPTMAVLGDYWSILKDICISYQNNNTFIVTNNSPFAVTGVTLLAEADIQSVTVGNKKLVSFGEPFGKRKIILPTIAAGSSLELHVYYGVKDSNLPIIISNDEGKNKVNEISGFWDHSRNVLTMTAAARCGNRSFTVKIPTFANKTVTVTKISPNDTQIGNYKVSSDGKISFTTELNSTHTFEIKKALPQVSLVSSKKLVKINQVVKITAVLSGDNNNPQDYTFNWSANAGSITQLDSHNEILLTAPNHKCTVDVKVEVKDVDTTIATKTISLIVYKQINFLKADDMRYEPTQVIYPQWQKLLDYMAGRKIKVCVGLICNYLEKGNSEFFERLKEIEKNEYFEIFNHGYDHVLNKLNNNGEPYWEFFNTPVEQQKEHFLKAQNLVKEKLGFTMHTFGAPGNKIDANTTKAIETIPDLKVWFLGDPSSSKLVLDKKNWLENPACKPDYDTFVKHYTPNEDYLVLHLHPINWSNDDFNVYIKILDFLIQQDVTFLLPYEYYELIQSSTLPEITLNHAQLNFGAVKDGLSTPSQTVRIENSGGGTLNWKAGTASPWLNIEPTSGSGSSAVKISVNTTGLQPGAYQGTISITDPIAVNSPKVININLTVCNAAEVKPPFGDFSAPSDGAEISGSIAVTGWVLDDIGVSRIKIYHEQTYIGDGIFVEGARPDVEKAYPAYPFNYRAGWGYMLLTNCLPGGGNGVYNLHVFAVDIEGNETKIGSKTIKVDNKNAVKPFGAIDTPAQGGTASGKNYIVNGWVLTPTPNMIPQDGSTIRVLVDGIDQGKAVYNIYRPDIESLFPGYANSKGAAGYFVLDTTRYKNGIHTIAWIVTDNKGNADGIGSRYFLINN
ncbi:MAG: DUF2334 domain-containing protein [Acidobacteria bacterium]|jgi:hypothetical protein|nr:DUF2334 domain-containing protein [Acidobacteriota bacterium]